jgi:hypothetical protein
VIAAGEFGVRAPAAGSGTHVARLWVIDMWWIYIVVPVLLILGVYGFLSIVGVETRWLTRKTDRRAEDLYEDYADPPRHRHRL